MRKLLLTILTAATITACNEDSVVAPLDNTQLFDDAALLAFGTMDMVDPGSHFMARLNSLPDSIKLTAAQASQIRALVSGFLAATAADRAALAAIAAEARAAHEAGKSREEIRAIFAQGHDIRTRLHSAETKLRADIEALLTPEQKAWLSAPRTHACRTDALQLTDAQKTEITALVTGFEAANRADLDAIKAAFDTARAAHRDGATREQIAEILNQVRPAMERVRQAQLALHAAIDGVLTDAQRESGCFGPRRHR